MLGFQKETERDPAQHVSPDNNKGGDLGSQEGFSTSIFHKERKDRRYGKKGREGGHQNFNWGRDLHCENPLVTM